jgi:hypothetical protein
MYWAGSSAVRSFSASVRSFSSSLRSYPVGLCSFSTGCRSFFADLPVHNFSCTVVLFLRVPAASLRTVRGTLRKSLQPFCGLPRSLPWASHGRTCNKLQDESAIGFPSCVMQLTSCGHHAATMQSTSSFAQWLSMTRQGLFLKTVSKIVSKIAPYLTILHSHAFVKVESMCPHAS